jgi:polygalacturonase
MPLPQVRIRGKNVRTGTLFCLLAVVSFQLFANPGCASLAPKDSLSPETILPIVAPFRMPELRRPVFPDRRFDIRDFGAKEGGTEKVTMAVHAAIAAASKAGGGVVVVPEGKWLSGAIRLESNINLCLLKGAELLFSQDPRDYLPVVFSRHEDIECYKYSSFIHAEGKDNIAITGEGVLNGQGKPWWSQKETKKDVERLLNDMAMKGVPVEERVFDGTGGRELRPAFFQPMNCTNVLVEGVTFLYGAFWTITPTYCQNVIVRRVTIVTEGPYGHTPNGDGVNPSSCRNVLIEDCVFDTGDDCIAIKAGRDRDGLRVGKPTENVVVRRCKGLRGHGGIVIGSETSGSIRNIYASDCAFSGTDRVVRIKSTRGRGGIIENMWFENLRAEGIEMEAVHINMLYTGNRLPAGQVSATTPRVRNIHFKNISVTSGKSHAIALLGLPEMLIENVSFDSITASTAKGIALTDAQGIRFNNIRIAAEASPLMTIVDCRDVMLDGVQSPGAPRQYLRVEGEKSEGILVRRSDVRAVASPVSLGPGVRPDAVVVRE